MIFPCTRMSGSISGYNRKHPAIFTAARATRRSCPLTPTSEPPNPVVRVGESTLAARGLNRRMKPRLHGLRCVTSLTETPKQEGPTREKSCPLRSQCHSLGVTAGAVAVQPCWTSGMAQRIVWSMTSRYAFLTLLPMAQNRSCTIPMMENLY